jgi:DNA invertase Pin-like site-specific DNA recombinase
MGTIGFNTRGRKMKTVACYVRVSTIGQNEAGQRREIERWLSGNGIDASTVRWYLDKATGDNLDRPGFERLQRDIFQGDVGTVVIWRLDRLSRTIRDRAWRPRIKKAASP